MEMDEGSFCGGNLERLAISHAGGALSVSSPSGVTVEVQRLEGAVIFSAGVLSVTMPSALIRVLLENPFQRIGLRQFVGETVLDWPLRSEPLRIQFPPLFGTFRGEIRVGDHLVCTVVRRPRYASYWSSRSEFARLYSGGQFGVKKGITSEELLILVGLSCFTLGGASLGWIARLADVVRWRPNQELQIIKFLELGRVATRVTWIDG